jgi:hypothetical protein
MQSDFYHGLLTLRLQPRRLRIASAAVDCKRGC